MTLTESRKNELYDLTTDILNMFSNLETFDETQHALECLWFRTLMRLLLLDDSYTQEELYTDINTAFYKIKKMH